MGARKRRAKSCRAHFITEENSAVLPLKVNLVIIRIRAFSYRFWPRGKLKWEGRCIKQANTLKNKCVPDLKGWGHLRQGGSAWSLPGDWWKQSFFNRWGKYLDLISGNLEISKLNQTPAIFLFFSSSSFSSFWFPWEAHQWKTGESPSSCWCNSASSHGPGGSWPELSSGGQFRRSHKRKVEAKTQAVWAATLYTLRGGKRPGKGDGEVITTCSFLYTPARHIHLFLHLAELHHLETLQLSVFLFHMGCNLTLTSINCRGGTQMVLAEIWPSVTH